MALDSISTLIARTIDRYLVIAQLQRAIQRFILARPKAGELGLAGSVIAPYHVFDDQMLVRLMLATANTDAQDFIAEHIVAAELDYPEAPNCCLVRVEFTLDKDLPAESHAQVSLTYQLNGTSVELMDHRLEGRTVTQSQLLEELEQQATLFAIKYASVI
jgi:hypothetical protein